MRGLTGSDGSMPVPKDRNILQTEDLVEAGCAFAIVLPLLFVGQITAAAPALSFVSTVIYGWLHRRELGEIIARRWLLLLIPAIALCSVAWSDYPSVAARHTAELLMTVLGGLLLSASPRPVGVLVGAWAAFGLFMVASLALGHSVAVGMQGPTAFSGLNNGKNFFGTAAAMAALMSAFVLFVSIRRVSWIGMVCAAAALGFEVYLSYLARSAGATIALALAMAAFVAISCLGAFRPKIRVFFSGFILALLAAAGAWAYTFSGSVTARALDLFHKDPTLTGRSYLWYRAWQIIRERPLLGRGFESFWVQGNIDAEGFWQYAQLPGRTGFNFHNTLIELLIQFGWIGTSLVLAVFVIASLALLRRAMRAPSLITAFYLALIVFNLARTPFESLAPSSVDVGTLLMITALGFGLGKVVVPKLARPLAPSRAYYPRRPTRYPLPAGSISSLRTGPN
jgi:exopolysaccharide production protein ExoQ